MKCFKHRKNDDYIYDGEGSMGGSLPTKCEDCR